jgi:hypothetical protein
LAAAVIGTELDEARSLEGAGRIFWAVERLEAAARLAKGLDMDLPGLDGLAARIEGLRARKEFGRFLVAEKSRDRRAAEFRSEFERAFGAIEGSETAGGPAVPMVLREMKIDFLRKEAKTERTVEDRSLASRQLFEFSFAAQARAAELVDTRDFGRAAAYLDLAIAACEDGLLMEKILFYRRAYVAALSGDGKAALKFLSAAVDKGFDNLELLEEGNGLRFDQGSSTAP